MSTATTTSPTAVGQSPRPVESTGSLVGVGALLRFFLRRDRVRIPVWVGSLALMYAYASVALGTLYDTQDARQARATLMSSPAAIMMSGPGYGTEHYTLGAMIANEMALTALIAVAIMNVQLIVRHTRAEEESGRSELVRAAVVGRHAPSIAAFGTALVANLTIAVAIGAVLSGTGLAVVDSFTLGAAAGMTGLVFAAVAVVTSQVTEHSRAAAGMGLAAIGAAWFLDATGNIEEPHGSWVVWTSPIGWAHQIRAFVDLRWWPLAPPVAAVAGLLFLGATLGARRDVGAGLVAQRAGRAQAVPSLRGPLALAWRQQRASILAWSIGVGVMMFACGTFVDSLHDMVDKMATGNSMILEVLGESGLVGGFISVMMLYAALAACAFAISSVLRARAEELAGRMEPLLATPVSRLGWLGAQLAVTAIGTALLSLVAGITLGLGALSVGATDPALVEYAGAALMYLPGIAVFVGLAVCAFGWRPSLMPAVWALLAYAFVAGLFGALLNLPQWASAVSPLWHVPRFPVEDVEWAPMVGLTGVALALIGVGLVGFRRRDVG